MESQIHCSMTQSSAPVFSGIEAGFDDPVDFEVVYMLLRESS